MANEYEAAKLRWAGGAQRPVWRGIAPRKTGARSACTGAHARPKPTSFDILKNGPKNIHAGESAANFSYSTSAATKPSIKAVFRKFLTKQRRRFIAGRIRALVKLDIGYGGGYGGGHRGGYGGGYGGGYHG